MRIVEHYPHSVIPLAYKTIAMKQVNRKPNQDEEKFTQEGKTDSSTSKNPTQPNTEMDEQGGRQTRERRLSRTNSGRYGLDYLL
jgi:hypothetical protein